MLGSEDMAILDFERAWWHQPGAKDQAIEFSLGLSAALYYERLLGLIRLGAAYEYDPMTVLRVREMVESPVHQELAV